MWAVDNSMECPSCRHVSREESLRFCSQCGKKLSPAAPVQDSENNNVFVVASSSEGKTKQGEVWKEEESPGSSKELENPEESGASWTIQMEVDPAVFVDASGDTAGGPEGTQCSPRKRKKKETAGFEVVDAEQSKKKRKKTNQSTTSSEAGSLPSMSSGLWSLYMPSSLGSQDSTLAQNQVQQAGVATMPMENGCVHAAGSSLPLQGHSGTGTDSGIGGGTQRNPDPCNHTGVKGLSTSKASVNKDLPPKGHCGPAPSACKSPAKVTHAVQSAPLPESKGQKSEHKEGGPVTAELAASVPIDATVEAANPEKHRREKRDNGQKQKPSPVSPAAAKHQHQEAKPKGKMADTERNRGEIANTPAEDQKKPEENRNYAAALKNQKEQRNQKAAAPEAAVRTLSPEDGVTVYFHAIVSRVFSFNPDNHRVCVRGGEGLGKEPWTDACEMNYTKDLRELGSLVEGSMVIPRQSLNKPIPYKYVIHRGGNSKDSVDYEFIYEESKKKGEHVNRSLLVDSARLGTGRDWHQYDDIICMKPPGMIQRILDSFTDVTRKDLVKGKKIAAAVMLDRIFSVLQPWSAINLQSFMTQFLQFYSVVRVPMVHEGRARRPWSSLQYKEKQVKAHLWEHVKTQMAPFLEGKSADPLPVDFPVRTGLKLGLTVLFMVEEVGFVVLKNDLDMLCYLLIPSAGSPEALHSDLSPTLSKPQKWCAYLVNLCCRCIYRGVDHWLGILPILHYCMQLSPPRRDSKSQSEDTWAGLEGICFAQFREKAPTKSGVLQFMQSKMALLRVDDFLFRSWFSLVPLESLTSYLENSTEYLSHVPARILDCLQGVSYRLRGLGKISDQNLEDVKQIFTMLIHLVDIYETTILGETLLQTYLLECLTLHETVCNITAYVKFYEVPALSADLVCKMLQLKPAGAATEGPVATDNEDLLTIIFQGVLSTTRNCLHSMFKKSIFYTSPATVRFTYPEEMALWRRLVEIDFPRKYGWKGSLLGDLEGRLKQEQPRLQISVFCSNQWQDGGLHDSVARSFEKCVIEAVSSACQVTSLSLWAHRGFLMWPPKGC